MTLAVLLALNLNLGAPAVVISVRGAVEVDTGAEVRAVGRFEKLPEGSTIRTGEDGTVQLRMASGSLVRLGPSTVLGLDRLEHSDPPARRKETLRLVVGRLWAQVTGLFGDDARFDVATENAVAGVRGTSFAVDATGGRARFLLLSGALDLMREGQSPVRLDQPNSFFDVTRDGNVTGGFLEGGEAEQLLSKTSGKMGSTMRRMARRMGPPTDGADLREKTRRDILGPAQLSDTGLSNRDALPGGGGGRAQLDIQIVLPEPSSSSGAGGSSSGAGDPLP